MPLIKSGSKKAVSQNIREMMAAGHPQKQAVAAALSNARRYSRKYAEGGDVPDDNPDIDTSSPIPRIVVRPRPNAFSGAPEGVIPKQGQSVAPSPSLEDIQGQTQRMGRGLFEGFIPQSMKGPSPEEESDYQRKYSDIFSNPDTPPGKLDLPQIYNESGGQAAVRGALEGIGMFAGPPGEAGILKSAGMAAKGLWPKLGGAIGGMGAKGAMERTVQPTAEELAKSLTAIEQALGLKPGELQAGQQQKSNKPNYDVLQKEMEDLLGAPNQKTTGWHIQWPGGDKIPENTLKPSHIASKYLYINGGDRSKAIDNITVDYFKSSFGSSPAEKKAAGEAANILLDKQNKFIPKASWVGPNNPYPELVPFKDLHPEDQKAWAGFHPENKVEPKSFAEASKAGDESALKYLSQKVPASDIPKFLQYYADQHGHMAAAKLGSALIDMHPDLPHQTQLSILNYNAAPDRLSTVDKIVDQMKDYTGNPFDENQLWQKVKKGGSAEELYKDQPLGDIAKDLHRLDSGSQPWRDLYKVYLDRRQERDFGGLDVPKQGQEVGFNRPGFHGTRVNTRFGRFKLPDTEIGIHFGTPRAAHEITDITNNPNGRIYPVVFRAHKTLDLPDLGNWKPDSMKDGLEKFTDIPKEEIAKAYEPQTKVPKYTLESEKAAKQTIQNFRDLLIKHGYDSIRYRNIVEDKGSVSFIVLDPKNIRSRFAKFEKGKLSSSHLAAGLAGAGYVGGYLLDKAEPESDKMANGGTVKKAAGGITAPWFVRQEARNVFREGMLHSQVPGRTDHIPLNVPGGSYVVPADIVSALGQGNSQAGGNILSKMFKSGPYGLPIAGGHAARINAGHLPKGAKISATNTKSMFSGFAKGGDTGPTPIMAAGGEYVLSPETVKALGGGDEKKGFKILDAFIKHVRNKHIKTLKKLPGPSKD